MTERDGINFAWYSEWSKRLAREKTLPELESMLSEQQHEADRHARQHLRAIQRTGSMSGNSMRRAHSRNCVSAAGDTMLAINGAIQIHRLFPEHALQVSQKRGKK